MTRVIGYRRFGDPEVLEEEECALPPVEAGNVCVRVKAAGINPVDYKHFGGLTRPLEALRTITHPSRWFEKPEQRPLRGVGQDFAGVVTAVGPGVGSVAVGDGVIGLLRSAPWQVRSVGALATEIVVPQEFIVPKPDSVSFEVAGGLGVAAQTAMGGLRCVDAHAGDVILVGGAAGGVGGLLTQLAISRGAQVIAIAGPSNVDYLRSFGAIPVTYGDGLEERVRQAAPGPITAAVDCHGGYAALAHRLGVKGARVGTIVPTPAIPLRRARFTGGRHGKISDIAEVASLIADRKVSLTIAQTYPFELDEIRKAYQQLMGGHTRGKIVITVP